MDDQALDLLQQFSTPATVDEVTHRSSVWPTGVVESAAMLFLQLGLLCNIEHLPSAPKKDAGAMLSAWLHVTNACTLRCSYCYLHKTPEQMTDDTARRAVDAVFRSAIKHQFKYVQLKYAGGEASLQMTSVLATHDYATQLARQRGIGLHAYIMSNGVVLPQRYIEQLKARHIGVMISLDGLGAYHDSQRPFISGKGSFTYVDRTITRLLASGLVPSINVTVSRRNLDGLPDLTRYILEHNLPFRFSYYRDNECSTHIRDLQFAETQMIEGMHRAFAVIEQHLPRWRFIDSLIDKASMYGMHQHTCGVGRSYMVIDQHGQVAKCHANIQQVVTTIDEGDPLQAVRDDRNGVQAIAVDDKQGCRSCEWRYWCTGGCPMLTYRITGRNDVRSPNCNIYKALFPAALRLEALRLLKYETPFAW
ncbi:MAG: radical SAM protein [Chloroflexi bacterium]|nr:radical SAM protein [Chloroflexota bacterium]